MRDAGHLNIGPLRMALRTQDDVRVGYADSAYQGFFVPESHPDSLPPLVELPVELRWKAMPIPSSEPIWVADRHWAVWEEPDGWRCCVGIDQRSEARIGCRMARDGSGATVDLHPEGQGTDPGNMMSPLVYPLDQILSWGLLAGCGGVLLHAAVAVRDGVGMVFAGHSGAGKSTLSECCRQAGWQILNDDRVMLFQRDGEWKVAGTPWHGSGRFAEATEVPLGGVFFLKQSADNHMRGISASQARLELLNVTAIPWFIEEWSQPLLNTLEKLIREMNCQQFHFTRSVDAVRALERAQAEGAEVCA